MSHWIESLPVLVLDVAGRCNCRCVMCDIWKRASRRPFATGDLARELPAIERLGVRWVVLTGGEPLMHPDLFRLSEMLRERGIRVTLLTTGLLLPRFAAEIARHIDDAIVSIDGPAEIHDRIRRVAGAFKRISAGIHAVRDHRPGFSFRARSTVQPFNCAHLADTVEAARELGCGSISFLAVDTHSSAFDHPPGFDAPHLRFTPEAVEILARQIEQLIETRECGRFIAENPEKLRRIVSLARGEAAPPRCNAPWVSAVLDSDGEVRPCFFHPPIGRAGPGVALNDAVNSPEAIRFRASLDIASNPICQRCVCSLHWRD